MEYASEYAWVGLLVLVAAAGVAGYVWRARAKAIASQAKADIEDAVKRGIERVKEDL